MVTKSNSKSMSNSNVSVTFKCFLSETSMYGIYQFTRRIIAIIQRSPAIDPLCALRVLSTPKKIAKSKEFFTVLYSTYSFSITTLIVSVLYSFTEECHKCCNTLYSVRAVAISLSGICSQYYPTLFFNNDQVPRTKSWIKTRELGNEYTLYTPVSVWYGGCNLGASTSCHVG